MVTIIIYDKKNEKIKNNSLIEIDSIELESFNNSSHSHEFSKIPSSKIKNTPNICTMKQSVNFCKMPKTGRGAGYGGYKWPRLNELAKCVGIKVEEERLHDARYDIELTMKSFFELIRRKVIAV